jgi:UDP-glucose 4-epimerase
MTDIKGKRLVYSSSASVYSDAAEIPMTEEHPFNNRTFYGTDPDYFEQVAMVNNKKRRLLFF